MRRTRGRFGAIAALLVVLLLACVLVACDPDDKQQDGNTIDETRYTFGLAFEPYGNVYAVTGYTGADTDVIIPSIYEGRPVGAIKSAAFKECTSLTSITIGDRVTEIGDVAFLGCTSLSSVTIPDSVVSLGQSAFRVALLSPLSPSGTV